MGRDTRDSEVWRRLHAARERWERVCEQCAKAENTFSVVVIGEQNSGKSTLCNALVQDWQNGTFPVKDVRETTEPKEMADAALGMTIVDTPGFGTYWESDEKSAKEELFRANLLVFVHSLNNGDLDDKERIMLETVAHTLPGVHERLLLVCSKLRDNHDSADEVLGVVARQCKDILGPGVQSLALDSRDYQEGKVEGEDRLVEYSRFGNLLHWLEAHRNMPSMSQKILDMATQEYEDELRTAQRNMDRDLESLWTDRNRYLGTLHCCWDNSRNGIQRAWDKCARYTR